jgi:hypothetical protein
MAHFSVYDTDVTTSATGTGDQNNGANPFPAVKANAELKLQPMQTDFAEYVTGSVETEKAGKLEVQISFDYPKDHENEELALEKSHWVRLEQSLNQEEGGLIKVEENKSASFVFFANAPYVRLVWKQGEAENKHLRLFARAQEKGRV